MSVAPRTLRATLDVHRRGVPAQVRTAAAHRLALKVDQSLHLAAGQRIAIYAALPPELDTAPLIALARRRGCLIYLPRIDRVRRARGMRFVEMRGALRTNRLGIAEPQGAATLGARWLDIVFLPLTGFDPRGVRLGSGGGFYDRAFAFRRWRRVWHAPRLVGLGYAFQELPHLEAAAHDVLMDAVVTEEGIRRCATG
ncbi:MAG: 5-formyltetrahydrofolate cyclo-ligase [Steroidobacterales bacterium]